MHPTCRVSDATTKQSYVLYDTLDRRRSPLIHLNIHHPAPTTKSKDGGADLDIIMELRKKYKMRLAVQAVDAFEEQRRLQSKP